MRISFSFPNHYHTHRGRGRRRRGGGRGFHWHTPNGGPARRFPIRYGRCVFCGKR